MAERVRLNAQELYDFALTFVPESGEISYEDLRAAIVASAYPEALSMLAELKKRKVISPRIEATPEGVKHTYRRTGGTS